MSATRTHKSLLAFVATTTTARAIENWCNEAGLEDFDIVLDIDGTQSMQAKSNSGRLVIVEITVPDGSSLHRVESIAQASSGLSTIIALVHQPSPSDVRRLFHNGISDVLSTPLDMGELRAALDRALQRSGMEGLASPRRGKLFTVIGSGGGVGVTTVATNLAREFLHLGHHQTAIVDLDLQFGALNSTLDIETRLDLTDAIRAGDRLDVTMLRSMMTRHQSGFDVLPASQSIAPLDVITPEFATDFVNTITSAYDCVVFDMPTAWASWFRPVLAETDVIIPVVEPSVKSAEGARRIMDAIRDMDLGTIALSPIVNRAQLFPASKDRIQHLLRQLNVTSASKIKSDDKAFLLASDLGACLRDATDASAALAEYSAAARMVLDAAGMKSANSSANNRSGKSKFSMFRSNA